MKAHPSKPDNPSSSKKYSAKFLWFIGNVSIISLILGIPFGLYVLLNIIDLFEIHYGFNVDYHLGVGIFIVILVMVALWIRVSHRWKRWALKRVKSSDEKELMDKINNEKESLMMKTWMELSKFGKIFRVALVFALLIGGIYMDNYRSKKRRMLDAHHAFTEVSITSFEKKYDDKRMNIVAEYIYKIDSIEYEDNRVLEVGFFVSQEGENGFEIQPGDRFRLKYYPPEPDHHKIQFDHPIGQTLSRYFSHTHAKMGIIIPDSIKRDCLLAEVYGSFGLKGLGILNNYDVGYWDNEYFNKYKFRILKKKEAFRQICEKCQIVDLDL